MFQERRVYYLNNLRVSTNRFEGCQAVHDCLGNVPYSVEKCGICRTHTGAMRKIALRDHKGFTLIELLAVMAIVAVLAAIVSVTVSGSGESSRDTQTRQDATTIQSAAADYFSDQVAAETLRSKTVTVLGQDNLEQTTSTRWPEDYISNAYAAVFPDNNLTTVANIFFLDKDGSLSDLRVRGLVQRFNAIDFNALLDGEFVTALPENADRTSKGFNNYLWLLEKGTAAGGSSQGASRKVAVFKLVTVENSETSNLVDLTYRRLVGVDFSDELPVALAQSVSTNEDTPKGITLKGIDADTCELTFIIASGPVNGDLTDILDNPCVASAPNADSASVIYSPDLNFNGEDSFTYTVIDGNGDDIATVTVTINVVNDVPVADIQNVSTNEGVNKLITLTGSDVESPTLSFVVTSLPSNGILSGTGASRTYAPDDNFFGLDSFKFTVSDGDATSAEATISVTVNAVNDAPSFNLVGPAPNQTVLEDSGSQSVSWAEGISVGPDNESGQTSTVGFGFNVTANDNPSLFSVLPAVADDGTLTYTPAANTNGVATIQVQLVDGGGTANGGDDTSAATTFTITIIDQVSNGGFESGLSDWTAGAVDVVLSSNFAPSEGSFSLDMNGFSPGFISQDIATVPGLAYTVLFDLAGNPGSPQNVKELKVSAASDFTTYEFDTTDKSGLTAATMGWKEKSFTFTATDTTTTLVFQSLHAPGPFPDHAQGPALDNVRVTVTVFHDDFEAETLGAQSLTNWTVTPATNGIDVIGDDGFGTFADEYPGNGLYVDTAGCTNGAIQSPPLKFSPGTYQLSFEIGNNPFNVSDINELQVTLGALFDQPFTVTAPAALTLTTKTIVVTTSTTASLVFQETGTNNCGGSVLEDVLLILLSAP